MSVANVVDSSGWLEYFADSERGESDALQVASMMPVGRVVDLEVALASEAARHPLPFAASIIYAAAMRHQATLWTQDEYFKALPSVRFFSKHPIA